MRTSLRDFRYAARQLSKSPGFSLTVMLTLALGIGATTAIFSLVEGILLRPLPFKDADRLVLLGDHLGGGPNTPVTAAPIRYMLRRPIRSEMCPDSGMVTNDTHEATSTADRIRSRDIFSVPTP